MPTGLTMLLATDATARLRQQLRERPGSQMTVDLESQTVTGPDGARYPFEVDAFSKECLLSGRDEIAVTLGYEAQIAAFEECHRREMPWLRASPD